MSSQVRWTDALFARSLVSALSRLRRGCLHLVDGTQEYTLGDPTSDLRATVHVLHARFYRRVVLGGGLGAAESFMDGDWTTNNLTDVIRIFIRNMSVASRLDQGWAWLTQSFARMKHWLRRNTRWNSRRNISDHYDLGNNFFQLFLDETLCYSSGLFKTPESTLAEASAAKMDRVCAKLDIRPDDQLLEIGTGWGGFALHAVQNYDCRVTTSTISSQQRLHAEQRIREAGLESRIHVLGDDYRDLRGEYDHLVSIEMIEAVGPQFLDTYIRQCSKLLRPTGQMLLQAIVVRDQYLKSHRASVDFIGKHIFPGGSLPSVTAICESMTRASDLRLVHMEDLSPHYAKTLHLWRQRFWNNIDAVRGLGFNERFIRMWDYYFCYCEASFTERQVNVVQMLLAKPDCRVDALTSRLDQVILAPPSGLRPSDETSDPESPLSAVACDEVKS